MNDHSSKFRRPLAVTVILAAALLLSGCGSRTEEIGSASVPSTAEADETLAFRPTTRPAPTATSTSSSMAASAGIAAEPDGPVAPLTGLRLDDGVTLDRPALVVKVDNHVKARPQTGLQDADVVFDLRAEGVTRFMAVFHSNLPSAVGPVRSSRTSDFDLLQGLDHPLYASSGGNNYVMNGLASLPIYELTNHSRSEYYRDSSRPAPHNLFVDPGVLYTVVANAWSGDGNPDPWFEYRLPGDDLPASAEVADGLIAVDFTNTPTVTFEWDGGVGGWLRSQDGQAHNTSDGRRLAPENVVILVTTYRTSAADAGSPEVRSTGSGAAVVLTDGHVVTGTWSRPTSADVPELIDAEGNMITLTPGRTWVLYPEAGQIAR